MAMIRCVKYADAPIEYPEMTTDVMQDADTIKLELESDAEQDISSKEKEIQFFSSQSREDVVASSGFVSVESPQGTSSGERNMSMSMSIVQQQDQDITEMEREEWGSGSELLEAFGEHDDDNANDSDIAMEDEETDLGWDIIHASSLPRQ